MLINLPDDIIGLVLSYFSIRKLASWVKYSDVVTKIFDGSYNGPDSARITILSNHVAVDWLLDANDIDKVFENLGAKKIDEHVDDGLIDDEQKSINDNILSEILSSKSKRTEELYKKYLAFLGFNSDAFFYYFNSSGVIDKEYVYNTVGLNDLSHEFTYNYLSMNYPNELKNIKSKYERAEILKIKSKPISEVSEWYKSDSELPSRMELRGLAANPYTWDIFYNYMKRDNFSTMHRYYNSIASNTSREALKYIRDNISKFVYKPNLYSNPSAYDIIKITYGQFYDPEQISHGEIGNLIECISSMCSNTNSDVIRLLDYENNKLVSNAILATNPAFMDVFPDGPHNILRKQNISGNPNPRITKWLKLNYGKINKDLLKLNPLIFPERKFTPRLINKIRST